MARTRSNRINDIKAQLIERLNSGFCRPGSRFVSNRELTMRLGIAYQTAHRLICELVDEGLLHRIPSSGTYVASSPRPDGVAFVFHPNTLKHNFGGMLLSHLQARFESESIAHEVVQGVTFDQYIPGKYNIIWGREYDLRRLSSHLHYSLMIDGLPEAGLNTVFTDSISVDHREAGRSCGTILRGRYGARSAVVLAGQKGNTQYQAQLAGFRSIYPRCKVIHQEDWTYTTAMKSMQDLSTFHYDAGFAVNDSAARALKTKFEGRIPITAYGDATTMCREGIDGVCIPWSGITDEAVRLYRIRQEGNIGIGHRQVITAETLEPLTPYLSQAS